MLRFTLVSNQSSRKTVPLFGFFMFVWTKGCDEVILIPFTVFQAPVTDHFIEAIDISSKLSVAFVDH